MMKKTMVLLSCLLAVTAVLANPRSKQEAFEKAQQFMQGKRLQQSNQSQKPGQLKSQSVQPNQSFKNFYIFNAESNGGFVIVSADDRTQDILGYANRGELDIQNMPCNMQWLLNYYETAITELASSSSVAASRNITRSSNSNSFVPALLSTQWGQNEPYNDLCPLYEGSRCLTGCIATAMAQMINYFRWPQEQTAAVPAYTTASNSIMMPELPAIQFDWNNMTDNTIAQLMLYCGQAVQMDYGLWWSSAFNYMASKAFTDIFGYNKAANYMSRNDYDNEQWNKILCDELQQGHPVLYFGQSLTDGGHAFIVDGYVDGMYHINWGWDGYCDGFFTLDGLNPDMENGYNYSQEMIVNICPPEKEDDYTPPTTTYFPRKIVMEEATGTWCGYCPYGMAAIEYMNERYPDNFIAIAIHDDNEMTPTDSYSPFLSMVTSFPSSRINRSYWLYPQPFNLDGTKDLGVAMIKANAEFTPDNQVEVSTETVFGFSANSMEYRIAYVVVEDNVGPYQQANYLSDPSAADNPTDLMNWWVHQGSYVETTYNDVARAIYDYDGVIGQLPRTITEGETYQCKYTITLPENVRNAENIKIVTLLIDTNTGEIINADRTTISGEFVAPTYFPRKIVMEEATGTWCGYCPNGIAAIEYMNERYPDNFIAIAIHDDEMTPTESYSPFLSMVTGFPSSRINRSYWLYPQPFSLNDIKDRGVAMIKAVAGFTSNNEVEVSTETIFGFSDNNTEYRIAYVVVEDNVGPYQQSNYLSDPNATDNPNDLMDWWRHQGSYVETIYNDVARAIYDYDGVVGQLPRAITEGETYQCKYTLKLPENVKNAENVKIVTLLIDTNTGEIINADRTTISGEFEVVSILINETNFPDKNFRSWLLEQSYGKDGVLTEEEIAGVTDMRLSGIEIGSLKGIELFTALERLTCEKTELTDLDLSGCVALFELTCYDNPNLKSLNVSSCTTLKFLHCSGNETLSSLDVSGCTTLMMIEGMNNRLTSLNVSGCTALQYLYCNNNELETLDVSGCTMLEQLYCQSNQLTSILVSECESLTQINCSQNQLTGEAMDAFISSLPMAEGGKLYVYDNKNTGEGNVCTKKQVAAAKVKGWIAYYTDFTEYEGSDDESEDSSIVIVDGIYYNLNADGTATVTFGDEKYSGDVVISETIEYENVKYAVTTIGQGAFASCQELTSVIIPNSLDSIGVFAFYGCRGLASVTLPSSVTAIGNFAFYECSNLNTVISWIEEPCEMAEDAYVFAGNSGSATLYVPKGTKEAYENNGWTGDGLNSYFSAVIEFMVVDEETFPDESFRGILSKLIGGNVLTEEEIKEITSLDISETGISDLTGIEYLTALTELVCKGNKLESLDVSKNTALTMIDCSRNQISGEAMDAFISSLPEKTAAARATANDAPEVYVLRVYDSTAADEGNVCIKAQVEAIKAKGWTPYYYNGSEWLEYAGYDDETTGISWLGTGDGNVSVYNMAGQKVNLPANAKKGVYIVNGKKMVVK